MDPKTLAGLTVYSDLLMILKDRGFSDTQAADLFLKITTQVEMEVIEEIMDNLTDEDLKMLDQLADDVKAEDIAEKLGLEQEYTDSLRAVKLAKVLEEVLPEIEKADPTLDPEDSAFSTGTSETPLNN